VVVCERAPDAARPSDTSRRGVRGMTSSSPRGPGRGMREPRADGAFPSPGAATRESGSLPRLPLGVVQAEVPSTVIAQTRALPHAPAAVPGAHGYRSMRDEPPRANARTCSTVAIVVSPG
jgi:hypothetical protein